MPLLEEVFGVNDQNNVGSYVKRSIEDQIASLLRSPLRHILVIYGSSKEGKSSVVRSLFQSAGSIRFHCTENLTRSAFHRGLLERARQRDPDYWTPASRGRAAAGGSQLDVQLMAEQYAARTLLRDVPIVIDNFHCVDDEVKREIIVDLREMAAQGMKTVVLGIWRSGHYLENLVDEVSGHVSSFPIEPWKQEDLRAVLEKGQEELHVTIPNNILAGIIRQCEQSISILQRVTCDYLKACGIKETVGRRKRPTLNYPHHLGQVLVNLDTEYQSKLQALMLRLSSIGKNWTPNRPRSYWSISFGQGRGCPKGLLGRGIAPRYKCAPSAGIATGA